MKTKKQKIDAPATREEMEALVEQIAALTLERDNLKLEMEEKILDVRAGFDARILGNELILKSLTARAKAWAEAHPEEFGGGKSIKMVHGVVEWRTSPHTVKPLSKWNFDKVLEAIRSVPRLAKRYIRVIEEINKEALIEDREKLTAEDLQMMGIKIVQEEKFSVKPREETLTPPQVPEVAA